MIDRVDLPPQPLPRDPRRANDEGPRDRFARLLEDVRPDWQGPPVPETASPRNDLPTPEPRWEDLVPPTPLEPDVIQVSPPMDPVGLPPVVVEARPIDAPPARPVDTPVIAAIETIVVRPDTDPVESLPIDTLPVDTLPIAAIPRDVATTDVLPVDAVRVEVVVPTEAPNVEPVRTEPIGSEPVRTEPVRADATHADTEVAPMPVREARTAHDAELISLPWQLRAHAGLSWLTTGVRPYADAGMPTTDRTSTAASAPRGATPVDIGRAVPAAPDFATTNLQAAQVAASADSRRTGGIDGPAAASTRASSAASAFAWPQRMLRWLADADTRTTVWIRDYALDAEAAKQLLQDVMHEAAGRGVELQRVMLNGHEMWRSPDSHQ